MKMAEAQKKAPLLANFIIGVFVVLFDCLGRSLCKAHALGWFGWPTNNNQKEHLCADYFLQF